MPTIFAPEREWRSHRRRSTLLCLLCSAVLFGASAPLPHWFAVASARSIVLSTDKADRFGQIDLTGPPTAMHFSTDGSELYIAIESGPGKTTLVRASRFGRSIALSSPLEGTVVAIQHDRRLPLLYLAVSGADGGLSVMDEGLVEQRRVPVCQVTRALVITSNSERAYLLCGDDRIAEIDLRGTRVLRFRQFPEACDAARIALSRTENVVYIPCRVAGQLWHLDRETFKRTAAYSVPAGVFAVAATPDRNRVVLTVPAEDRVVLADPYSRTIVASVQTPARPTDVVVADGIAYVLTEKGVVGLVPSRARIRRHLPTSRVGSFLALWPSWRGA